jgi:transcriptional regulator with XRE-family HTH domain
MSSVATAWVGETQHGPTTVRQSPDRPDARTPPAPARRGVLDESPVIALVGQNLRRLRRQHRISLEELARRSGVSRAMLGQIEQAKSVPSIKTLWQVAQALEVSVSWFLEPGHAPEAHLIPVPDSSPPLLPSGQAEMRSLRQTGDGVGDAFLELRLAAGASLSLPSATASRRINVAVAFGVLQVAVEDKWHLVRPREALQYESGQALAWRNAGQTQALAFVVLRAASPVA